MISIALRNLFGEKTRLLISIGGVAFSVMLILVIISLYRGWQIKSTEYIREVDTDLWVSQDGATDLSSSASIIYPNIVADIKQIPGVKQVDNFLGRPVQFQIKNRDVNAYIVGFDITNPTAGPKNIIAGTGKPKDGEIVVDKVLARNHNLELGEYIDIFGTSLKVVGIADGSNMFIFQFSFVNLKQAANLFKTKDLATYLLVKVENGQLNYVQSQINKIPGIEALEKTEFVDRNRRIINEVFLPIITVLVIISIFVGTTVIGLTIYTATIDKSREFGVIKALGGSSWQIYRIIFEQALVSGVIGYFVGVGLTYFLLWLIPQYVASFVTVTLTSDLFFIFAIAMVMSIVASYTPVRRIVKIDPALVFKS